MKALAGVVGHAGGCRRPGREVRSKGTGNETKVETIFKMTLCEFSISVSPALHLSLSILLVPFLPRTFEVQTRAKRKAENVVWNSGLSCCRF